ncbi:hypothetical protein CROQUDRAFT_98054 [Cronartium quercuum f. sp. fusiforme G11]|uniref:Uncharacterized protein n=1 Tax=Cronartium quercuum f. sp. fusiforme G11 TaxID=708437 RepID=A0A9P6T7Z3_9BASI|nr:hypothetical protein CROQUDRAFT_98054 [Cronartium quercuum f. sp. fusiforme G11]
MTWKEDLRVGRRSDTLWHLNSAEQQKSHSEMVTKLMGQGTSLENALAAAFAIFGDPEERQKCGNVVNLSEEEEEDNLI